MNLFLDTDIGSDVDDALALALIAGSPELDLTGVSTVYGDTKLRAQLAKHYLRFTSGADIPIAAGLGEARSGKSVWWTGHEGSLFSTLDKESVGEDGVQLLVENAAASSGDLDVLAIGPLTNIAAALDRDPSFERNVRRLVIMGGDFRQDDAIAEHNFNSDVSAAQRVFQSELDIVVGGLDLTLTVQMGPEDVAAIASSGPLGDVLAQEIRIWWLFNENREAHQWNSPHDPTLALWLAEPQLFSSRRARVTINDAGLSTAIPDPAGHVTILGAPDPVKVKEEIVRRIVLASASSTPAVV